MYTCEIWAIKKFEGQRINVFELWCWRRLLRVPWTPNRSNQSILKESNPEYSLEGLMLKLNLQYFGHLIQRVNSLEKSLMLGKIEGRRRRGWQRMRWFGILSDLKDMSLSKLRELAMDREAGVLQSLVQACWILKELDRIYWLKNDNQKSLLLCVIAKLKCLYYET